MLGCCDNDGDVPITYDDCPGCLVNGYPACFVCDDDSNGVLDGCTHCVHPITGSDECWVCDSNDDGTNDTCNRPCPAQFGGPTCYVCDTNGNGYPDDCLRCGPFEGGYATQCWLCDSNDDGVTDTCTKPCGTGEQTFCYSCDTNENGHADSCHVPIDDAEDLYACDNLVQITPPPTPPISTANCFQDYCTSSPDDPCGSQVSDSSFCVCCAKHDACYSTCGNSKDVCDLEFQACMWDVCSPQQTCAVGSCITWAGIYFNVVSNAPDEDYYEPAQLAYCGCCEN